MLDTETIRRDFPILKESVNGKQLVYLDSAATSQRPIQVIDSVADFYMHKNANVARGLHKLAEEATSAYEEVRGKVRSFINAKEPEEIIFTKNTTEGINTVMRGWGERNIRKNDKIVTTILEHHSNFVPWQQLARWKGAKFEAVGITDEGELDMADFEKKAKGAKIVALSAASNVIGTISEIKKIARMVRELAHEDAIFLVDGAQSVPSMPTDVKSIDCDFLVFSGHKMLAPFGSGVLYGKRERLEKMDPFIYGSEMIRAVGMKSSEWSDLPYKFEPGTPDVAATIGLGAAIDYLGRIGMEDIRAHEEHLAGYAIKRMGEIDKLTILGPHDAGKRVGLVSFTMDDIHPHDVAAILDEDGIAVRSGHHCAMPLHEHLGISASTRASFYIYNTKSEIDALCESLRRVKKVFS